MADVQLVAETREVRLLYPSKLGRLTLVACEVDEALSQLYEIRLDFVSPDASVRIEEALGERLAVELDSDTGPRRFHGICTDIAYAGRSAGFFRFRATLRPHLWLMTQRVDCRIFQDISARDIVKKVIRGAGFSDIEDKTLNDYAERVYCVQYNETDENFISRLMEEEGIYYFFKQEEEDEILVLCDDHNAHVTVPDFPEIEFFEREKQYRRTRQHIFEWHQRGQLHPGKFSFTDYNFEKPNANLMASKKPPMGAKKVEELEIYDYPGGHMEVGAGERRARIRAEAHAAEHMRSSGVSNVRWMAVGQKFKLKGHDLESANREYLIVSARHRIVAETDFEFAEDREGDIYTCTFEVMPAEQPYRAPWRSRRPRISGPQTAVVVGPKGEEIYTDKYGRVKVQFHWDREGKLDEFSSLWIRHASYWSGQGWGAVAIPRIGQEVVVEFEEGNPDRPLITGMLYNGRTMPPYALPANASQSGIRTNSTKGGGGANEIQFEDKKGQEKLNITAERDYSLTVKNDATISVGFQKTSPGKFTQNVYGDVTETIEKGNHSFTVKTGTSSVTIKAGRSETIQGGGDALDVTGVRSVKASEQYGVEAPAVTLNGKTSLKAESPDLQINGKTTTKIGSAKIDVDGSMIAINGTAQITLSVGGSSIKLDPSGVTIVGPLVKIN
ncbi:MAG TPA: type VI secretion system tip protein TssI/VgrG [Paracoccaceae bacterium]|nr:type VI secretion system tip protein TssI/VgrG [Paracoccaceae bacterium]